MNERPPGWTLSVEDKEVGVTVDVSIVVLARCNACGVPQVEGVGPADGDAQVYLDETVGRAVMAADAWAEQHLETCTERRA